MAMLYFPGFGDGTEAEIRVCPRLAIFDRRILVVQPIGAPKNETRI
ncbi:MAG: hypothetical protein ACREEJ_01495 [Ensifer adhaerens]